VLAVLYPGTFCVQLLASDVGLAPALAKGTGQLYRSVYVAHSPNTSLIHAALVQAYCAPDCCNMPSQKLCHTCVEHPLLRSITQALAPTLFPLLPH
jgi:hypothetical protein